MHVNTQDVLIAICSLHTFHALHWTTPKAKPPNQTHAVAARLSHYSLRISYAAWHALHCRIHTALHNSKSALSTPPSTLSTPHSTLYTLHPTVSCWKKCAPHFPVLLRTAKLAQSASQYSSILQALHKVLHSTTLYIFVLQKHLPVLLCTTSIYKPCIK